MINMENNIIMQDNVNNQRVFIDGAMIAKVDKKTKQNVILTLSSSYDAPSTFIRAGDIRRLIDFLVVIDEYLDE